MSTSTNHQSYELNINTSKDFLLETKVLLKNKEYFLIINQSITKNSNSNFDDTSLSIILEDDQTPEYYANQFSSKVIEQISLKSKAYKSYHVFLKMLLTAMYSKTGKSPNIDLIMQEEVEEINKTISNNNIKINTINIDNNNNDTEKIDSKLKNKIYLVLSYQNEFESAHYPLELNYIDNPGKEFTFRTIRRLNKIGNSYVEKIGFVTEKIRNLKENFKKQLQKTLRNNSNINNLSNTSTLNTRLNNSNMLVNNNNNINSTNCTISAEDTIIELSNKIKFLIQENGKLYAMNNNLINRFGNNCSYQIMSKSPNQNRKENENNLNNQNKLISLDSEKEGNNIYTLDTLSVNINNKHSTNNNSTITGYISNLGAIQSPVKNTKDNKEKVININNINNTNNEKLLIDNSETNKRNPNNTVSNTKLGTIKENVNINNNTNTKSQIIINESTIENNKIDTDEEEYLYNYYDDFDKQEEYNISIPIRNIENTDKYITNNQNAMEEDNNIDHIMESIQHELQEIDSLGRKRVSNLKKSQQTHNHIEIKESNLDSNIYSNKDSSSDLKNSNKHIAKQVQGGKGVQGKPKSLSMEKREYYAPVNTNTNEQPLNIIYQYQDQYPQYMYQQSPNSNQFQHQMVNLPINYKNVPIYYNNSNYINRGEEVNKKQVNNYNQYYVKKDTSVTQKDQI